MRLIKFISAAALMAIVSAGVVTNAAADSSDEAPPPAEYPYPNAPEEGFAQKPAPRIAEPTSDDPTMTDALIGDPLSDDVSNTPLPPPDHFVRRAATDPNEEQPIKRNRDGSFVYGKSKETGVQQYESIHAKEINYNEHEPAPLSDHSIYARFAYFGAPTIQNPQNNLFFKDIYSAQRIPSALFDYEWKLSHSIGDVGVKVGSGIFFAQGRGRWVNADRQSDPQQPLERFSFIMFPTTVTGIYRFKYQDRQVLVPYLEGGGGAFTFMETRDDSKGPKFGGAPALIGAAGLNILVDGLDRDAMLHLRQDYAINHLYFNLEFRQIIGFGKYDFTSSVYCGGLGADF